MKIKQRLGLDYRNLVGIGVESMHMQFVFSCFKIDVAERLQAGGGMFGKLYEKAAIASEFFQVHMTLPIQISAHFLDLKISHITESPSKGAFMISLALELETLN